MMDKQSVKNKRLESRRDFIKGKVFGGVLGALSLPFFSFADDSFSRKELIRSLRNIEGQIDWNKVQKEFTIGKSKYYFNSGSNGPSPKVVVEEVVKNIRSSADKALNKHSKLKSVRQKIAYFLNVPVKQIGLTNNATEGMNIAAHSIPLSAGDEVILSRDEHIGGAAPWIALQESKGIQIKLVDLDPTGKKNLAIIKKAISAKTKVLVLSHVTCTSGLVLPIKQIVKFCRKKGIYSCIDGAQSVGMISVDLADLQPDIYTASGHKWLFGPEGTGILYMSSKLIEETNPIFAGAYTDAKFDLNSLTLEFKKSADRYEFGTRNTSIVLGLGTAIDFISDIGIDAIESRGKELATYFKEQISVLNGIELITPQDPQCTAAIVTIRIPGENVTERCNRLVREKRIQIRGIYENNLNAMRFSFAIFNTKAELDYVVKELKKEVK